MKNKTWRFILLGVVVLLVVACAYGGGFVTGQILPTNFITRSGTQPSGQAANTPTDLQTIFEPFWQAWDLAHQNYVDPVDDAKLMEGAIKGMMEALGDPHTAYWTVQEAQDFNRALQGSYSGIGAYVNTDGDYLTIIEPISGSPAEKAGLKPGDQILAVDGKDVAGMDPDLVRTTMVMGEAGTDVKLTVLRKGEEKPFDVTITRQVITIPSVESKMLDNNIAYIKISIFGQNTATDFHDQLGQLMAQNPKALILDLRNNGGGYLTAAVSVASEFLDSGVVTYEQGKDGTRQSYDVQPDGLALNVPMVVLVNQYTASASEIVSGALQDYGRARLVGVKTYGKGTVQLSYPLDNGGEAHITIARWLTPNGNLIDKLGITPDQVVEITQADYDAGKDPQLDAAIQLLLTP
jgi:carboxyl-terminal processing protease